MLHAAAERLYSDQFTLRLRRRILADQAAAVAKSARQHTGRIQPASPHTHLLALPAGDGQKLVVLMYCERDSARPVGAADSIFNEPKDCLIEQTMRKALLGAHILSERV